MRAFNSAIALAMALAGADAVAQTANPLPPSSGQQEPIVSDEDFNRAIPKLDDAQEAAIDQPLESIEEFERKFNEGQPPVPELSQPLPPLEQFQVEPVQFSEAAPAAAVDELTYRVQLNGIEAADALAETDLAGQFRSLSALREGDGRASGTSVIWARLREDEQLVRRLLLSEGWFEPVVQTRLDTVAGTVEPVNAVIDVQPGQRYVFSDIRTVAAPTLPPDLVQTNLSLKRGEPIIATRVIAAEAELALALGRNGYPFAELGERDIELDRAVGQGIYSLPVTIGPRARFGGIAVQGETAFGAEHAAVIARFRRGDLYDSRQQDDLREALIATGLFSAVAVEPERTGQTAPDGAEYVTMMVTQEAGPPRSIALTAGRGPGEGVRAEVSWTHRNLFPPEGALVVNAIIGTSEQALGATLRRSNAGQRDRTLELSLSAAHRDYEAYSAYTGRLAARISRDSTPIWQKRHTWALGVELIGTAEEDYNFDLGRRDRRTYYIAGLSAQYGLDLSNDLLDPRRGFRVTTLIQPEGSLANGFQPYVRGRIDGSVYYPFGDSITLAGRARLGSIVGAPLDRIAPSRRLYAGGGGSVRGFGYQQLGQRDPDGRPLGGRSVAEAAFEVRYRFGDFGVVGFLDVGQSYAAPFPRFSDLRAGVGIGARYYTTFGPVRLDIATPLGRREGEAKVTVYASIGQAF